MNKKILLLCMIVSVHGLAMYKQGAVLEKDLKKESAFKGEDIQSNWHEHYPKQKKLCPSLKNSSQFFTFPMNNWRINYILPANDYAATVHFFHYLKKDGKFDTAAFKEYFAKCHQVEQFFKKYLKEGVSKKNISQLKLKEAIENGEIYQYFSPKTLRKIKAEIIESIAQDFKIHLQIKPEYLDWFIKDFIVFADNDPRLAYIDYFKYPTRWHDSFTNEARVPVFVIYVCPHNPSDRYAFMAPIIQAIWERYRNVIDIIKLDYRPRYNSPILTGFLYLAGGNAKVQGDVLCSDKMSYKDIVEKGVFKNTVYTKRYKFFKGWAVKPIKMIKKAIPDLQERDKFIKMKQEKYKKLKEKRKEEALKKVIYDLKKDLKSNPNDHT